PPPRASRRVKQPRRKLPRVLKRPRAETCFETQRFRAAPQHKVRGTLRLRSSNLGSPTSLASTPNSGRASPSDGASRAVIISEKQYPVPAGLARNCRFFYPTSSVHSPLLRNAGRSL